MSPGRWCCTASPNLRVTAQPCPPTRVMVNACGGVTHPRCSCWRRVCLRVITALPRADSMTTPTSIVAYLALFAGVGFAFLFINLLVGKLVRPHDPHSFGASRATIVVPQPQ